MKGNYYMRSQECRFFKKWLKRQKPQARAQKKASIAPVMALGAAALMGATFGWAEEEAATAADHPEVLVQGEKGYNRNRVQSSKYTESLRNIPQTITVIPKEVMADQNATSMRQVLRNVPGISMQAGEGGVPAGDNLTIRGFNARTDFYIDGMRDFGGYSRDPFALEAVEVSKGPSSATAGRGSTGGSINQVSKMPSLEEFINGSVGVGTDDYRRLTADANQIIDGANGTAVRVNALWHESNTPRRDEVEEQRWGIAPSIAFGLNSPTQFSLSYYKLAQENTPDYGIPFVTAGHNVLVNDRDKPAPVDMSNFYGSKIRDYENIDTDVLTGELKHELSDDTRLRNITRIGETYRDSVITAPRFVSDSTTTINRQLQSRDQEDSIVANQLDLTTRFNTGPVQHDVVVGLELAREEQHNFLRNQTSGSTTDLFNPNPYDPYTGRVYRNGTDVKATAETTAGYAFDTLKIGEHVQIPLGLRWESFDVELSSNTSGRAPVEFKRTDRMLSGRAAIVVKPTPASSLYAGYGTSFNPSAEGLTSGFTAALANVEPEKTKTYEVGTKWDLFNNDLSLSGAVFRTYKTNARTPDPSVTGVTILDGEQRVDGYELGVTGNITDAWQVFTGYTHMDSEIRQSNTANETGKHISNTPEESFNVWSTYALPSRLSFGAGVQYVGQRFANNTNTRQVGSYTLYDAMASYPVNDSVTVRLNVNNITNEEYFDRLGGGHLIPGAGRSATITTDVKFGNK